MNENHEDNLSNFAKETAETTKELTRELFATFRETAFPDAKRNALDYQTICGIEDEFRTQEAACLEVIEKSFKLYCDESEKWLNRFKYVTNACTRMVVVITESFLTQIRGHHFTYDLVLTTSKIPACAIEALFQESFVRHDELFSRQKIKSERLRYVYKKALASLQEDELAIQNKFKQAIEKLLQVDLPESHTRIEAIINQNYLQKAGALHGMN